MNEKAENEQHSESSLPVLRDFLKSPLHRAALLGDDEKCRELIASGSGANEAVNVNPDSYAYPINATPLMVAAGSSDGANLRTLQTLIECGADPTIQIDGRSALYHAFAGLSRIGPSPLDVTRVQYLIDIESPFDTHGENANRALCIVAGSGDIDCVDLLIRMGVNPDGYFDQSESVERHNQFRAMMERMSADDDQSFGSSFYESLDFKTMSAAPSNFEIPLFRAAESGDVACVKRLIEAGADPRKCDNRRRTALFEATSVEVVRELVSRGLSLQEQGEHEWSPLTAACFDGLNGLKKIEALLAAGADPNETHDRGYTVFMSPVTSDSRHVEVLKRLVAAGADPHAVTELGWNVFHAAIDVDGGEANSEENVRAILGYLSGIGVNINHKDKKGRSPLTRALLVGTPIVRRVLIEQGADVNEIAPRFSCGSDDDSCETINNPIIINAIELAADGCVAAMLEAGVNLDVVDQDGLTPLEVAEVELEIYEEDDETKVDPEIHELFKERLRNIVAMLREREENNLASNGDTP